MPATHPDEVLRHTHSWLQRGAFCLAHTAVEPAADEPLLPLTGADEVDLFARTAPTCADVPSQIKSIFSCVSN
jgi:hypothetical protein